MAGPKVRTYRVVLDGQEYTHTSTQPCSHAIVHDGPKGPGVLAWVQGLSRAMKIVADRQRTAQRWGPGSPWTHIRAVEVEVIP